MNAAALAVWLCLAAATLLVLVLSWYLLGDDYGPRHTGRTPTQVGNPGGPVSDSGPLRLGPWPLQQAGLADRLTWRTAPRAALCEPATYMAIVGAYSAADASNRAMLAAAGWPA